MFSWCTAAAGLGLEGRACAGAAWPCVHGPDGSPRARVPGTARGLAVMSICSQPGLRSAALGAVAEQVLTYLLRQPGIGSMNGITRYNFQKPAPPSPFSSAHRRFCETSSLADVCLLNVFHWLCRKMSLKIPGFSCLYRGWGVRTRLQKKMPEGSRVGHFGGAVRQVVLWSPVSLCLPSRCSPPAPPPRRFCSPEQIHSRGRGGIPALGASPANRVLSGWVHLCSSWVVVLGWGSGAPLTS